MIEVNEALTRKVAELARLELTDAEVSLYTRQLGEILKYVDQLGEANVVDVTPLVQVADFDLPRRPDDAHSFEAGRDGKPKVLDHAPAVVGDGFQVPNILGTET